MPTIWATAPERGKVGEQNRGSSGHPGGPWSWENNITSFHMKFGLNLGVVVWGSERAFIWGSMVALKGINFKIFHFNLISLFQKGHRDHCPEISGELIQFWYSILSKVFRFRNTEY